MQTVTLDNFVRAETDRYFASLIGDGALGRISHNRDVADVANQTVVRMNRDTIYSFGVFDLDAEPVTITLPDSGGRFMSLLVVNQDHYALGTFYDSVPHRFSREDIGTRYVALLLRTFVDPTDPSDLAKVHALQDAIKVEQELTGSFEIPKWDKTSLDSTRAEVSRLGHFEPSKAFGTRDEVDPTAHLIGTALGWGGNPARDATYASGEPTANDGSTVYRLTVKDVPVDGFWSISVYNQDGFFEPNAQNTYSLNNLTAKADADGSYALQFGGCGEDAANCLPIMPGWNYTVRMYRPRPAILEGSWKFPEAEPMELTEST
jgi:hypothetical protein